MIFQHVCTIIHENKKEYMKIQGKEYKCIKWGAQEGRIGRIQHISGRGLQKGLNKPKVWTSLWMNPGFFKHPKLKEIVHLKCLLQCWHILSCQNKRTGGSGGDPAFGCSSVFFITQITHHGWFHNNLYFFQQAKKANFATKKGWWIWIKGLWQRF